MTETVNEAVNDLESLRVRLLDLTSKNRLLNFKHTKTSALRVIDELPNQLVDTLLSGEKMRFVAVPEPTEAQLIEAGYLARAEDSHEIIVIKERPNAEAWAKHLGLATSYEVPVHSDNDEQDKHNDDKIQSLLYPYEMEKVLKGLFQKARLSMEETGVNILYLAFGFVEWPESTDEKKTRLAPLFMLPVSLTKGNLNKQENIYEYTLNYSGEEVLPNLSLREKLKNDFAMALPDLDENTVPEEYFYQVAALIDKKPNWNIHRYISLTLLNFSKLLMWSDLDPEKWPEGNKIDQHEIISKFLSSYKEGESEENYNFGFGEEFDIDAWKDTHSKYPLISDADSSQHSALVDVLEGKSLVIEGPPGTGKSQTITNIIAAALGQGKKVLFVAEKLAALDVVKRRLDTAGLGQFCLELHSHKSQKTAVLENISARINSKGTYRKPAQIDVEISRYEEIKEQLREYAENINTIWKATEKTAHEILSAAAQHRLSVEIPPNECHPKGISGDTLTPLLHRKNIDALDSFTSILEALETTDEGIERPLKEHPWYGLGNANIQLFDLSDVVDKLSTWNETILALDIKLKALQELVDSSATYSYQDTSELCQLMEQVLAYSARTDWALFSDLNQTSFTELQNFIELGQDCCVEFASLSKKVSADYLADLSKIDSLTSDNAKLRELLGKDISFELIGTFSERLGKLLELVGNSSDDILGIKGLMPEQVKNKFTDDYAGLKELHKYLLLVSSLKPEHMGYRSQLLDLDETDSLLESISASISELTETREKLGEQIYVDKPVLLQELQDKLAKFKSGGLFKVFDSEWRGAKRWLSELFVRGKVDALLAEEYQSYLTNHQTVTEDKRYTEFFGSGFDPLKVEIEAYKALRSWYVSVREEYGIGFGERVNIGQSILDIEPNLAQIIRTHVTKGLDDSLAEIIDNLHALSLMTSGGSLREETIIGKESILNFYSELIESTVGRALELSNGRARDLAQVGTLLQQLSALRDKVERFDSQGEALDIKVQNQTVELGPNSSDSGPFAELSKTYRLLQALNQDGLGEIKKYIAENPNEAAFSSLSERFHDVLHAFKTESERQHHFFEHIKSTFNAWFGENQNSLEMMMRRNDYASENHLKATDWISYLHASEQLNELGLSIYASLVDERRIAANEITEAYLAGVFDVLSREIITATPILSRFSGVSHEQLQRQFQGIDKTLQSLQSEKIAYLIDQQKVNVGHMGARASEHTGLRLIERECEKKKRHIPLRALIRRAGQSLVALKPCFMMSPMSVAQYLEPGCLNFDLVVMDEASQIKPEDALGAMGRGTQIVIVGDPKQLPPTAFFDKLTESEDDDDELSLAQSESILEATASIFSKRRLRWHYRSKHESLIAFSNHSFYENDLVVFPSPFNKHPDYGVKYTRVHKGTFANNRNLEEVRVITESVREHVKNRPDESLGIVAMNSSQRDQIEMQLETLAKEDVVFRQKLDEINNSNESIFIKNLENVQGDERDVIYISMTYGPSQPGLAPYQRFGPINSATGWRRLNVLLTRARTRMHIFSSLDSSQVLADQSKSRGVQALKNFLAFCETGILHENISTNKQPDSDFEIAVINQLRDQGYECEPQVGVAGFFIDVAVIDPGGSGKYLMGIECDGATYHSGKTARDRDRLRQEVLERLGWKIRRIWSTDWFKDPQGELKPILAELESLKTTVVHEETPHEQETIEQITEFEDASEELVEDYAYSGEDLVFKLKKYNEEIISREMPQSEEEHRLLRPSMIEALNEMRPTNRSEFLEMIPRYLREGTDPKEGKYLDAVFEIINASI
jgi:superfamily I DNA and/or RNA helicase/very-short-patch-repair endonuclease